MTAEQVKNLEMALDRVTQQQEEFQQMFDAKAASLADMGLGQAGHSSATAGDLAFQRNFLQGLSEQISKIKKQVTKIAEQVYSNELRIDKMEQYSRSNCLILHGCTDAPDGKDNLTFENHVVERLSNKLDLDIKIQNSDIDICHNLPSKKHKNPTIIKFVRRTVRDRVFSNKKKLNSNGIGDQKLSLTECLTKRRLKLLEETRRVFGFKNCWSFKGDVYCFFNAKRHKIEDYPDIQKIRFPSDQINHKL